MQLLGTGTQRASKASQVIVTGTPLSFASWDISLAGVDIDTTNFTSYILAEDTTFTEGILGTLEATGSFGGDWDAGTNPLDDPPGLYPRDDLTGVDLVVNQGDASEWIFDYMRIRTVNMAAALADAVTFTVGQWKSQGEFTFPIGSV